MTNFDPERYTISIYKEIVEGESLFIAKIAELPDITEYADSYEEARILALDSIETGYKLCRENGIRFPEPLIHSDSSELASGRVTLRMPKTLHARLIREAEKEEVSLNQYLVSALSVSYGESHNSSKMINEVRHYFDALQEQVNKYQTAAATYLFKECLLSFKASEASPWVLKQESFQ